jgi:hypothetical protein
MHRYRIVRILPSVDHTRTLHGRYVIGAELAELLRDAERIVSAAHEGALALVHDRPAEYRRWSCHE